MTLEYQVAQKLTRGHKTLALAESCTGGLLSHRLTNIPGSSGFLMADLVVYSNLSKIKLLKISRYSIAKHGAVSSLVAKKMAVNVRRLLATDYGIAITGIAGPTGATPAKPLGLTFIAVSSKSKTICSRYIFQGNRTSVKSQAASQAFKMLLAMVSSDGKNNNTRVYRR